MAIPKSLKNIDKDKAMKIIEKQFSLGNGDWDGVPMLSDFVYKSGNGYKLIRPGFNDNTWETGVVSM